MSETGPQLRNAAISAHPSHPGTKNKYHTGIWHGWIAPISLIWGLFDSCIRVYEPINTGWWYDFGFYIAIIGGFGGIAFFRRRKKKSKTE
ncbi:MAG: hypothetical protein FJ217_04885 [Ignavibacteria bacterium]|nr:hypothetical protein [Ignavibacteria bacterium]